MTYATTPDEVLALRSETARLRTALRYFVGCAYPVAKEINPRGHDWRGEDALDFALGEAQAALADGELTVRSEDGR